jgi:quercetin dioxygenase-like cupin family protein
MIIKTYDDTETMNNPHGLDARNLYNTENAMITLMRIKPGESLRRHITPVDVAFFVLEGEGIVEVGDEKATVGPNTLIESPKDIMHCWYNESDADLKFLIIKAPKPTAKTIFLDED